ncbi:molybdate ABC transporter substrate-binding protein [Blastococcus sp. PRF04-17]|uniref:molybdate ABC transporter substrate-binding protein n=1 Tax=Blastococcus sp. PRF04-17 TaxID=2933797 RepID=UPI001FF6B2CD|nr:molybdate ABC transporter substrate-binding protein [Blastococcus sp. PRF04-17]UOY00663.1 molybdate ABC transporter substrate-binding protein [Blastococcus sp. PRF04-17]
MRRRVLLAVACLTVLVGCGGYDGDAPPGEEEVLTDPQGDEGLTGTLTVFAAASLTDVFTRLGEQLMEENPQLDVRFNVAGSSALAAQLLEGAPADVFAAADEAQMSRVQDGGLIGAAELFAENPLMLAVPIENPAGVALPEGGMPSLSELVTADMTVAVCAPEVPCGAAAAEVLEASGRSDAPDTYEDDVRAVLTKVQLGEVDAGLIYLSDVHAAGDSILAFAFREAPQAVNRYPIGALEDSANPDAARAFVDLVLSAEGQQVLADAGFLPPS